MNMDVDEIPGGSCPHMAGILANESAKMLVLDKFRTATTWNYRRMDGTTNPAKRRKISSPNCGSCGSSLSRPFACLLCHYTGCFRDGHILEHSEDTGHHISVDIRSGSLYCSGCEDIIYDQTFDDLHHSTLLAEEENATKFQKSKHPREPYKRWQPGPEDMSVLSGFEEMQCQNHRGLLNLGQTCFLNVVLQSLAHNPLLRNYFLSDKHNARLCKTDNCTCCEMDNLFTEIYSPDPTPFGPIRFLATTWRASSELSGYSQQDAHECFISTLNALHTTSRGSTNVSCNCVVHSTFAGQLQSDVRCGRCGNVTSTVDPMLDINLELKARDMGEASGSDELTLAGCLRKFTQPEKLGMKDYICTKCAKPSHDANKRMSIRKLPPVLSFQFKRFEHKTNDRAAAQKIDARVRFPAAINMAPYTSLALNAQEPGSKDKKGSTGTAGSDTHIGPDALYDYDLFAVICHEGAIDNGHYYNFARFEDEWYRFDDDKVSSSNLGACLSSQAYMCFYVKRHLDYQRNTPPTYVKAREAELRKAEEKARKEAEDKARKEAEELARSREVEREVENELLGLVE